MLDLSTLRPVPWLPGTAMVLCDLTWLVGDHTPVAESPRAVLGRQLELGSVWAASGLSLDDLEVLVDSYFGRRVRHALARARLLGLMSNYGWTLWASIQRATSDIDFDFWTWGMDKYECALAELDGSGFDRLLAEATRID